MGDFGLEVFRLFGQIRGKVETVSARKPNENEHARNATKGLWTYLALNLGR